MRTIAAFDFESYYDTEVSLSKLPIIQYVKHERWEPHLLSVATVSNEAFASGGEFALSDCKIQVIEQPNIRKFIALTNKSRSVLWAAHNAVFDLSCIKYGLGMDPPLFCTCSKMLGNFLYQPLTKLNLGALAEFLFPKEVIKKDKHILSTVKGSRYSEIKSAPTVFEKYVEYSRHDSYLLLKILSREFKDFRPDHLREALELISRTLELYLKPSFVANTDKLEKAIADVEMERVKLCLAAGLTKTQVRSRKFFARALMEELKKADGPSLGHVAFPMKISKTTKRLTPAFSASDGEFIKLRSHHTSKVRYMVEAKLALSSTIVDQRAARLIGIMGVHDRVPILLNVASAKTHRMGGGDSINPQNFPPIVNEALEAPPGFTFVSYDAKQIEARVFVWLIQQESILKLYEQGVDVYTWFVENMIRRAKSWLTPVLFCKFQKVLDQLNTRHVGKIGILSLPYGASAFTVKRLLAPSPDKMDTIDNFFCEFFLESFYSLHDKAPALHKPAKKFKKLLEGWEYQFCNSKVATRLPNGRYVTLLIDRSKELCSLQYDNLQPMYYKLGANLGYSEQTVTENLCQHIAIQIMWHWVRCVPRQWTWCLNRHDSNTYCIPDNKVDEFIKVLEDLPRKHKPDWAQDLPLAIEISTGRTLAEVK